jgi:hypothetical protein
LGKFSKKVRNYLKYINYFSLIDFYRKSNILFIESLELETIAERKSFIRSFIKKIWIDYPTSTIEYTIPISNSVNSNKGVLIFNRVSCPK